MIKIANEKIEVQFSLIGAEIINLYVNGKNIAHDRTNGVWSRNAPVLFPIVGGLKNNTYSVNEVEYNLSQHGFARDMEFEIVVHTDNYIKFKLDSNEQTKKVYPYDFELYIEYMLIEDELATTYIVVNNSKEKMFYQIGGHPAFKIDFSGDYLFELLGDGKSLKVNKGLIEKNGTYSNVKIPLVQELFKNDALIFIPNEKKIVNIYYKNELYISMKFDDFILFGLWAPVNKKCDFVCLEPWNGCADFLNRENNEFSNKDYIEILEVNKMKQQTYITKFNLGVDDE